MTAADLAAIREALELIQRYFRAEDERDRGAGGIHYLQELRPKLRTALAALDRIEADTLTPEEAHLILSAATFDIDSDPGEWSDEGVLVAKLRQIAGDTGEAT